MATKQMNAISPRNFKEKIELLKIKEAESTALFAAAIKDAHEIRKMASIYEQPGLQAAFENRTYSLPNFQTCDSLKFVDDVGPRSLLQSNHAVPTGNTIVRSNNNNAGQPTSEIPSTVGLKSSGYLCTLLETSSMTTASNMSATPSLSALSVQVAGEPSVLVNRCQFPLATSSLANEYDGNMCQTTITDQPVAFRLYSRILVPSTTTTEVTTAATTAAVSTSVGPLAFGSESACSRLVGGSAAAAASSGYQQTPSSSSSAGDSSFYPMPNGSRALLATASDPFAFDPTASASAGTGKERQSSNALYYAGQAVAEHHQHQLLPSPVGGVLGTTGQQAPPQKQVFQQQQPGGGQFIRLPAISALKAEACSNVDWRRVSSDSQIHRSSLLGVGSHPRVHQQNNHHVQQYTNQLPLAQQKQPQQTLPHLSSAAVEQVVHPGARPVDPYSQASRTKLSESHLDLVDTTTTASATATAATVGHPGRTPVLFKSRSEYLHHHQQSGGKSVLKQVQPEEDNQTWLFRHNHQQQINNYRRNAVASIGTHQHHQPQRCCSPLITMGGYTRLAPSKEPEEDGGTGNRAGQEQEPEDVFTPLPAKRPHTYSSFPEQVLLQERQMAAAAAAGCTTSATAGAGGGIYRLQAFSTAGNPSSYAGRTQQVTVTTSDRLLVGDLLSNGETNNNRTDSQRYLTGLPSESQTSTIRTAVGLEAAGLSDKEAPVMYSVPGSAAEFDPSDLDQYLRIPADLLDADDGGDCAGRRISYEMAAGVISSLVQNGGQGDRAHQLVGDLRSRITATTGSNSQPLLDDEVVNAIRQGAPSPGQAELFHRAVTDNLGICITPNDYRLLTDPGMANYVTDESTEARLLDWVNSPSPQATAPAASTQKGL